MNRRDFLKSIGEATALATFASSVAFSRNQSDMQTQPSKMLARKIPSSGEFVPAIGMGTWQTFNVRDMDNAQQLDQLSEVLKIFHEAGGRVIDSSPMYGS